MSLSSFRSSILRLYIPRNHRSSRDFPRYAGPTETSSFRRTTVASGASLVENGLLVGLIAIVAIAALSMPGSRTSTVFCDAAHRLGAPLSCDLVAGTPPAVDPADPPPVPGDPEGSEDPEAPIALLTLTFDVPGDVFDLDDPEAMRFTVGGLRDNAGFDWQIVDTFDAPYLSGSDRISGTSREVNPETGEPRPGRITVSVTAPLPDGSAASAAPISRELVTMDAFPDESDHEPSTPVISEALPVDARFREVARGSSSISGNAPWLRGRVSDRAAVQSQNTHDAS